MGTTYDGDGIEMKMRKVSYTELWQYMMSYSHVCGCKKCRDWIKETENMMKHSDIEWNGLSK